MRRIILPFLIVFLLTGCTGLKVLPKFPDHPLSIGEPCPKLILVPEGEEKFSEVLNVVTTNYGQYNKCSAKVDAWISWYNEQKKVYEGIK